MTKKRLLHAAGIYNVDSHAMYDADALLIEENKIVEIGFFHELLKQNADAETIDLSECWLFPGLIDTHVHLECDPFSNFQKTFETDGESLRFGRALTAANALLRSGVTTVRDAGSDYGLLQAKDERVNKIIQLPRLKVSGPPITITGGHLYFMGCEADTTDELIHEVRVHQKRGCDAIKIMVTGGQMTATSAADRISYTVDQLKAAVDTAHALGLPTFAHCLTVEGFSNCMNSGIDSIEHCACFIRNKNGMLQRVFDAPAMERFRGEKRFFSNTLASLWHNLDGLRKPQRKLNWQEEFLVQQENLMLDNFMKHCELGLIPVLSTDAGVPNTPFDDTALELEIMVYRCGFSCAEAMDVATVNSAACLGMADCIGKLKPGYYADIVALKENALNDISAWRKINSIFRNGEEILYPAAKEKGDLYA